MKAITDHTGDRAQHLIDTFITDASADDGNAVKALANVFSVLADSFRTEADLWAASKKKGWQSIATRLREAAKLVGEVGDGIAKLSEVKSFQLAPPREPIELSHATNGQGFVHGADPSALDRLSQLPDATSPDSSPAVGVPLDEAIAGQGDTLAYLRGDTDTLPTDLKPSPEEASVQMSDINEEARQMTQTFPIDPNAMTGIVNGPLGALPEGDFTEPVSVRALMRTGYVPVQLAGQTLPTFASLLTPPPASIVPDHWSWSQLESSEGCGLRYRLGRVEGYTQIPQWANIGGDAFHMATAGIDRTQQQTGAPYPSNETVIASIWEASFNQAIADVASTSPVPISEWRAANGGKENQDWWRVEGEAMLQRWCEERAKLAAGASPRKLALLPHSNGSEHAATDDRNHAYAVEWPFTITVPGPLGELTYTNIVDRVWECADGTLLVEDLKTGSRIPKDTGQLGTYAWGVASLIPRNGLNRDGANPRIMGAFYNARKGLWTPAVDLLAAHPWDEFVYRLHTAEAKRRAGLYSPHVTDLCSACSVRYACPLMNRDTGSPKLTSRDEIESDQA